MPTLIFSRVGACPPCSPRAGAHAEVSVAGLDECCLETAISPEDSSKDNHEDTDVKTQDDEDYDDEETTNSEGVTR